MNHDGRTLLRATPVLAQRVWARHQRPSARSVARALQAAGFGRVHWTTIARWRAQNWKAKDSAHPLESARAGLEALAPLMTGDPATGLDDLVGDPDRDNLHQLSDAELLRKTAREVAIATILLTEEIRRRVSLPHINLAALAPAVRSIAGCIDALPDAFEQVLALRATKERPSYEAELCADTI